MYPRCHTHFYYHFKDKDVRYPNRADEELVQMNLKFYNFDLHRAAFALPNFIRQVRRIQLI